MKPLALHGDLGHDDADDEEADRRLHIGPAGDVEPLVGLGQKEIERERGHQRRHVPGEAIAGRGNSDDHGDEHQRSGRGGEGGPERDQQGSHTHRERDRAQAGNQRAPAPKEDVQTAHEGKSWHGRCNRESPPGRSLGPVMGQDTLGEPR